MTRKIVTCLVVMLLFVPAMASAQYVWGGAAMSLPIGDAGDALKSGWLASVGVGKNVGSKGDLSVNVEGLYGSNSYKVSSGKQTMFAGLVNVECDINHTARLHPYVYAGGGFASAKPEGGSSQSKGAWQIGAGIGYKVNDKWTLWGDARYLSVMSDPATNFVPVTVGLSWSGGM